MVRKIFYDQHGTELDFFINNDNKLSISIKDDDNFITIVFEKDDFKDLKNELNKFIDKILNDGK